MAEEKGKGRIAAKEKGDGKGDEQWRRKKKKKRRRKKTTCDREMRKEKNKKKRRLTSDVREKINKIFKSEIDVKFIKNYLNYKMKSIIKK